MIAEGWCLRARRSTFSSAKAAVCDRGRRATARPRHVRGSRHLRDEGGCDGLAARSIGDARRQGPHPSQQRCGATMGRSPLEYPTKPGTRLLARTWKAVFNITTALMKVVRRPPTQTTRRSSHRVRSTDRGPRDGGLRVQPRSKAAVHLLTRQLEHAGARSVTVNASRKAVPGRRDGVRARRRRVAREVASGGLCDGSGGPKTQPGVGDLPVVARWAHISRARDPARRGQSTHG